MMKIDTTVEISKDRIQCLLCTAFEGGSNYWYTIDVDKTVLAPGLHWDDFREGGKMQDPKDYWHWSQIIPVTEGCHLVIGDKEDPDLGPYILDMDGIRRGLQTMAEKYPRHFSDFLEEHDDATTGDVFLQCCLFGEARYS